MFGRQSIGALILAALRALDIAAFSTYAESPLRQNDIVDYLTNPFEIVDNRLEYIFDGDLIETSSEFLDRSTIIIDKDAVTIDGINYTNVWLSEDAAQKFKTDGFDLATAFNLQSHNEGTFVSGTGYIHNVPIYYDGENYQSQILIGQNGVRYHAGDYEILRTVSARGATTHDYSGYVYLNGQQIGGGSGIASGPVDTATRAAFSIKGSTTGNIKWLCNHGINGNPNTPISQNLTGYQAQPFDFDWVSGEIPAPESIPSDVGLNIQVPTSVINNFYIQYPQFDQPNVTIDLHDIDPSIFDDLIMPLIPIINTGDANVTFSDHETPPEPQTGTIANEPWESLRRALQDIKEQIQIGNTIQNTIKAGQDIIAQLISPINTILQTISESIGNIIDKIETGSIDFFRDTIRSIRQPFSRWFGLLAQNLGIWHYVVEWLQNIAAPFSWFWNVFSNVNLILISPVYALFAATLVIAIYRRFGR